MSSDNYAVPETFDSEEETKESREEEANDGLPDGWEAREHSNGRMFYMDHNTQTTQWERPTGRASTPEYVRKAEETAARRAEIKKDIRESAELLNWNADKGPSPPWDTHGAAERIIKALNLLTGESNANPTHVIELGGEKKQRTQKRVLQRKIKAAASINIEKKTGRNQLETQLRDVLEMLTGAKPISGGKRKTRKRKRKYKKRKTRKGRKSKKHKTRKR